MFFFLLPDKLVETNLQINEKNNTAISSAPASFLNNPAVWIPGESSRTLPVFPNLAQTKLNDLSPCKQLPVSAAGVGLGVTAGKQSDLRLSLRVSLCHARPVGYMSAGSGRTRSLEEKRFSCEPDTHTLPVAHALQGDLSPQKPSKSGLHGWNKRPHVKILGGGYAIRV